ncbi:LOW QUALITY PROTEIN: uncharacterized protein PRD47_015231 [Ara ararauna]
MEAVGEGGLGNSWDVNWLHPTGRFVSNHRGKSVSGARKWKMWIFLVWILFPGGWAVIGPTQVVVNQGSSLAVSCSYEPGYELYSKFWCRRGFLGFCICITHTDGSEVTVTQDRVSIRDNHTSCSFTVTLDHVTQEDAGWYSCGVERKMWFSLKHSTEVMVSKGKARLGAKQGCVMEPITWERGSKLGIMGVVKVGTSTSQALRCAGGCPSADLDEGQRRLHRAEPLPCSLQHLCFHKPLGLSTVSSTTKGNDVSPLVTTGFGKPPVLSQPSITYLLLILCVKVPVVLLLMCVAAWVRSRCRNHGQNLQLEVARTRAPGLPKPPESHRDTLLPLYPSLCWERLGSGKEKQDCTLLWGPRQWLKGEPLGQWKEGGQECGQRIAELSVPARQEVS